MVNIAVMCDNLSLDSWALDDLGLRRRRRRSRAWAPALFSPICDADALVDRRRWGTGPLNIANSLRRGPAGLACPFDLADPDILLYSPWAWADASGPLNNALPHPNLRAGRSRPLALHGLDLSCPEHQLAGLIWPLLPQHESGDPCGVTVVVIFTDGGTTRRRCVPNVLALVELDTASAGHCCLVFGAFFLWQMVSFSGRPSGGAGYADLAGGGGWKNSRPLGHRD